METDSTPENEFMISLGKHVRSARLAMELTQADAAGLLGVGVRFLSELERGKPTLEIGRVVRVLRGLGLTLDIQRREGTP